MSYELDLIARGLIHKHNLTDLRDLNNFINSEPGPGGAIHKALEELQPETLGLLASSESTENRAWTGTRELLVDFAQNAVGGRMRELLEERETEPA